MKHVSLTLLLALALAGCLSFAGCGDGKINISPQNGDPIGLKGGFQSECKSLGGADSTDGMNAVLGEVSVQTTATTAKVIHNDVRYHCAADITFNLKAKGSELTLTEVDTSTALADCICPIDLEVQIVNLTCNTSYRLMLYNEDHSILFANKIFTTAACGSDDEQCVTASDCEALNLVHPECVGQWYCITNQCSWECGDTLPCSASADCPVGYFCEAGVCAQQKVACSTDVDCSTDRLMDELGSNTSTAYPCNGLWQCIEGYCEYACQENRCSENRDCDAGYRCVQYYGMSTGYCEPIPVETKCSTDADCAQGFHCEWLDWAVTDPECITNPDGFVECNSSSSRPTEGVCVEDSSNVDCYSDSDCPVGYICNFVWYENDGSNCSPDAATGVTNCLPAAAGQCIPSQDPPEDCFTDADCPTGYLCVTPMYAADGAQTPSTCGIAADGSIQCVPMGVCIPWNTTVECATDNDCADGMHCEYYAVDYATGLGSTDNVVSACDPSVSFDCPPYPVYGVCVYDDYPRQCWNSWDCSAGWHCEFPYVYNDDGTVNSSEPMTCYLDDAGNCLPPNPGICVQDARTGVCNQDADCAYDEVCLWTTSVCDPLTGQCYPYEVGVCVPSYYTSRCYSNADCQANYECSLPMFAVTDPTTGVETCYPNAAGECQPISDIPGVCVPSTPIYGECGPNASCPAGYYCNQIPVDCASGTTDCYGYYGFCMLSNDPSAPCVANADCASGLACVNGLCQTTTGNGFCGGNADCAPKEVCVQNCASNGQCEPGYCIPTPGSATGSACAVNTDCAQGQACFNGLCSELAK